MKNPRLYPILALLIALSLAVTSGCSAVATPTATLSVPAVAPPSSIVAASTAAPATTAPVVGSPDLVITKVWLEGQMINYTVRNAGTADSPQTYSYIYVNDLFPAQGGSSLLDVVNPGQERTVTFSNYQWPFGKDFGEVLGQEKVDPRGYIELPNNNKKVKVCADAMNEAKEAVETNNCKVTIIGLLWDYDLLSVSNLATWRNGDGDLPEPGSENNLHGAHFQIPTRDMEVRPQLETIPQQVPQGWMQGTWGFFYSDVEYGSPKTAAISVPAKLHFVARVGLASNAAGSDGVTFKFGLKDLNDTVTWIASKKASTPGGFEDWDINLGEYEGQKLYFILRVDAGASPVNDFAIWNQARLIQVND